MAGTGAGDGSGAGAALKSRVSSVNAGGLGGAGFGRTAGTAGTGAGEEKSSGGRSLPVWRGGVRGGVGAAAGALLVTVRGVNSSGGSPRSVPKPGSMRPRSRLPLGKSKGVSSGLP